MYSKIKIAGHPVHPMLVAFPVACCTITSPDSDGTAVLPGTLPADGAAVIGVSVGGATADAKLTRGSRGPAERTECQHG